MKRQKRRNSKVCFSLNLIINTLFSALDEGDIQILKKYGQGPYSEQLKQIETDIEDCLKRVNELCGVKESDTGLAPPALWDIAADKQAMQQEQPLQVESIFQFFYERLF
jgi:hypothetical protein